MGEEKIAKYLSISIANCRMHKSRGIKRMQKILVSKEFQKMFESKKNQMCLSLGIKKDSIRPHEEAQEAGKKEGEEGRVC